MSSIYPFFQWHNYPKTDEKKMINDVCNHKPDNTRINTWKWVDAFIEKLPKNSIIYDIGCGNGRNMSHSNHEFIGVDNSKKLIDICRKKSMNVMYADICNLPFKDNTADVILSIASFHHLDTEKERFEAMRELYRVLKPKGRVLLSVWSIDQPHTAKYNFEDYEGNHWTDEDNIVDWINNHEKIYKKYYYIFRINELTDIIKKCNFWIINHRWEFGNEIFELRKI